MAVFPNKRIMRNILRSIKKKEMNVSQISKKTGHNPITVNKYVKYLLNEGKIKEIIKGKRKFYIECKQDKNEVKPITIKEEEKTVNTGGREINEINEIQPMVNYIEKGKLGLTKEELKEMSCDESLEVYGNEILKFLEENSPAKIEHIANFLDTKNISWVKWLLLRLYYEGKININKEGKWFKKEILITTV